MASESETVRAEFERWLLEESIGDATARHPKGLYVLPEVEDQWFVWRAAWQAARSSTPSAEAKDAAQVVDDAMVERACDRFEACDAAEVPFNESMRAALIAAGVGQGKGAG